MTAEAALEWAGAVGVAGMVAAITFAANRWIDAISRLTDEASDLFERFNTAANALLDDERTPMPVAEFVARFSKEIGKPQLADWFIEYQAEQPTKPKRSELSAALAELPSELAGQFATSVLTALFLSAAAGHPWKLARRRARVEAALENVVKNSVGTAKSERVAHRPAKNDPPPITLVAEAQRVPAQMQRAVAEYVEMQPSMPTRRRELLPA
jgi:hypothetical protein